MVHYFDSSFLLSILLDEKAREASSEVWDKAEVRVSSILLKIEVLTVLRRSAELYRIKLPEKWLERKTVVFKQLLSEIHLRTIDEDIYGIVERRKELASCRSLDAIHAATAWEFGSVLGNKRIVVCTYDERMKTVCRQLSIKTV
ncbi:MAG TPA: PIN domain-containing protein [Spirochaetales bacterium]|nr:PIN domain-containing protein [Spirochaetales bacterium]